MSNSPICKYAAQRFDSNVPLASSFSVPLPSTSRPIVNAFTAFFHCFAKKAVLPCFFQSEEDGIAEREVVKRGSMMLWEGGGQLSRVGAKERGL